MVGGSAAVEVLIPVPAKQPYPPTSTQPHFPPPPALLLQLRDRARRFITLVDELYNHRVRLVVSAEVPPDELFVGADNEEPIIDLESLQVHFTTLLTSFCYRHCYSILLMARSPSSTSSPYR